MVGNLPELAPKSVSRPHMATITGPGTPNCCSMRAKTGAYCRAASGALEPRRHHAAGKLFEALAKHALGVVARNDRRVVGHAAERRLNRALRDALRRRLLLEGFKPGAEVAAAGRSRERRRRDDAEAQQPDKPVGGSIGRMPHRSLLRDDESTDWVANYDAAAERTFQRDGGLNANMVSVPAERNRAATVIARLACRAVARAASEGWWSRGDLNP